LEHSSKKNSLTEDDFVTAFKEMMKKAEKQKDFDVGPIVVYENVTKQQYLDFCKRYPDFYYPLRFYGKPSSDHDKNDADKVFGQVTITRLTTDVHGRTIDRLLYQVKRQACVLAGNDESVPDSLEGAVGVDCNIGFFICRKLDGGMSPDDLTVGGSSGDQVKAAYDNRPFPNLAIEIAFKNEDRHKLVQELLELVSPWTSIQVAIGIKIEDMRTNGGHVLMSAYVFRRNQAYTSAPVVFDDDVHKIPQFEPEQQVEFGTDVEYPAGGLSIHFPLADLYFGSSEPASVYAAIQNNCLIEIDLGDLRDRIVRWL
jgi:hypothetical protein